MTTASSRSVDDGDPTVAPVAHRIGLALATVAWVASGAALLVQPQLPLDRLNLIGTTLTFVCGAIIVLRTDTRLIGWCLVAAGVCFPLISVYFQGGPNPPPETVLTEFLNDIGEVANGLVLVLLLVFPTGRFESRLQRVLGLAIVLPYVVLLWGPLVVLGLAEPLPEVPFGIQLAVFAAFILLGLGRQIRRYRHRPRVEQLQIKWFLLGIAVFLGYPIIFAFDLQPGPIADIAITSVLPLAVLAAITRYRLYEIDRIVSRTLAYALVVVSLGAVFVGGVALVTALLPTQDRLAVVLTTLAVVALFDPLRRRVTVAVDRRFDRTRYVARQVVDDFGRHVRDVTDLDEVVDRVRAVAGATLSPATVAVWQPAAEARR